MEKFKYYGPINDDIYSNSYTIKNFIFEKLNFYALEKIFGNQFSFFFYRLVKIVIFKSSLKFYISFFIKKLFKNIVTNPTEIKFLLKNDFILTFFEIEQYNEIFLFKKISPIKYLKLLLKKIFLLILKYFNKIIFFNKKSKIKSNFFFRKKKKIIKRIFKLNYNFFFKFYISLKKKYFGIIKYFDIYKIFYNNKYFLPNPFFFNYRYLDDKSIFFKMYKMLSHFKNNKLFKFKKFKLKKKLVKILADYHNYSERKSILKELKKTKSYNYKNILASDYSIFN